jgi:PAS domain S-box-containing protein
MSHGTDPPPTNGSFTSDLRVLLIEDNPGDARLVTELFRESGQAGRVWHKRSLSAALTAIEERSPDVALVDLGLPDSTGPETIAHIGRSFPALPIVVLTGQENKGGALSTLEAGATEYLQKDELSPSLLGRTLRWAAQRKSMEQRLERQERELSSLTGNITQGIYRSVPGEGFTFVNQAFADLFGYESPEEMMAVDPARLYVHPERRDELRAVLGAEGHFENEEVECRRKDGSTFVALQSGSVARDASGEIVSYDGALTDITERREAQRQLARSEALTQSVLDGVAANIAVLGPDGTLIDVNERWRRFARENGGDAEALGVGANYLAACTMAEHEEGTVLPAVREQIRKVIEGKEPLFEHEYPCHGPEEERWFLLRATPLDWEEGGAVVAHINVTERVKAERTRRVLSEAVEQTEEAVVITEAESQNASGPRIEYVNRSFEAMTGYAEEEVRGKTPAILQGPETDPAVVASQREALAAGEQWEGEATNYRKDGTPYRVQWSVSPVRDEEGAIKHWVSVQRDVTEEREREARLQGITNSVPGVVYQFCVRPDGPDRCTFVSDRAEEVLGIPSDPDTFHQRLTQGIQPPYDRQFLGEIAEAAERTRPFRFEMPFESPAGETIWLLDVSMVERRGEEVVFNGVLLDVTERREATRGLERMAEAMDVAYDGMALLDEEGAYTYMNEAHADIFGYDAPEALLGNSWRICYDEAQVGQFEQEIMPTLFDQGFWQGEVPGKRKDGTLFPQFVTLTRLKDGGIICVTRDITEQKRRERRLERTANLLRLTEEITDVGGWTIDLTEEPPYAPNWTENLYALFGLSPEADPPAEEVFEYYHPEDRERHREAVMQAAEEGTGWDQEIRLVRADGTTRWVQNIGRPVVEEGTVVEIRGALQDVTDRKERERALRRAKAEAEEAAQFKSTMLANMSHEVRTPLTAINGFTEILKDELSGQPADMAARAHRSGKRLLNTLNSVLELSQLEAGTYRLTREPMSLCPVVEETIDLLAAQAEANDIQLRADLRADPLGNWNDAGLHRICENLVENAIKFTPAGGAVTVQVREEGGEAVLTVEDTGIGISEEALPEIFEAFQQESTGIGRKYEGTGLGLSIVRRLTDAMEGTLSVETEKGVGTRVTIRLPARSPTDASAG